MKLDVPYQSQKPLEKREAMDWCALASLWMVIAYYLNDQAPTLEEIHQKYGSTLQGKENFEMVGIDHKDILMIARDFGLAGFRKSWFVKPGVDSLVEKFKAEGESDKDITKWEESNLEESLFSLENWINQGIPVIVSVSKEFSPSQKTHIVVLVGVENDHFLIHDPYLKGENFQISKEDFKKYFLRQAIVIYPL